MKAAYDAKKAAKEAEKVRMQKKHFELRKVSPLFNISSWYTLIFLSQAAFKVGDLVKNIPGTAPGVNRSNSVAVTSRIIELKCDGGWFYNISAILRTQNTLWIPEHRVRTISKSIFGDCYIKPRAGHQAQLTVGRERAKKWKRCFAI